MACGRLGNIRESGINEEAVVKLDAWLSELPDDFAGSVSPLVFASQAKLDKRTAAEIFNYACRQKVLKLDFEVICPMCGRCMGMLGTSGGCKHQAECPAADSCRRAGGSQLRVAYHLNSPLYN